MIPIFSFPTKVVLVDDDPSFLNDLQIFLDKTIASYRLFNSSKKALRFFNQVATFLTDNIFFLENQESYEWGTQSFSLNFSNIKNIALNSQRFDQVSVVIADYNMPNMDGLELLKNIHSTHITKILLTGEANEATAIEAFNDGIIHKYIRKQDSNLIAKIKMAIAESQKKAFCGLSSKLIFSNSLFNDTFMLYSEPALEAFYWQILKEKNIVESYLADKHGSYLLLDAKGNSSGFFVRTEDQLRAFDEEILGEAEIPNGIKYAILNRDKIVCFLPQKDKFVPEDFELGQYIKDAKKFGPEDNYYAAYLESFPFFPPLAIEPYESYSKLTLAD